MPNITGETKLLALIGSPVSHSLSPRIHNRFAESLGLPYAYMAFDVVSDGLERFTDAARLMAIAGFNVTMPLKESIIPYLDTVGPEARNAVNTVVNKDGALYGYNTDGGGFVFSLERERFSLMGKRVLILGAGGAAKAVASALVREGAFVRMASRVPNREVEVEGAKYCHWKDIEIEAAGQNLLVNATPLGMQGVDGDFSDLSFLRTLAPDAVVYDLIYSPRETKLLKAAGENGFHTINGISHLVCQAAMSFELFTGYAPSGKIVDGLLNTI